jgi:hypothetical protein
MKSATKLMLSTLAIAAAGAMVGTPAQADTLPNEWLDAQIGLAAHARAAVNAEAVAALRDAEDARDPTLASTATRTRAAVKAEAVDANRRRSQAAARHGSY